MTPLRELIELVPVECPTCGIPFALSRSYFDARVVDRQFFWCPNAHNLRLGVEAPHEARIRDLELAASQQGLQIVSLRDENARLRTTIIDQAVGAPTVEGT